MKEFLSGYGAIMVGLAIGVLARIGEIIAEHGWPRPRDIVAQLFQLGIIGLIAAGVTVYLEIESDLMQAMVAAIFALSGAEISKFLRKDGWRRFLASQAGLAFPEREDKKDD